MTYYEVLYHIIRTCTHRWLCFWVHCQFSTNGRILLEYGVHFRKRTDSSDTSFVENEGWNGSSWAGRRVYLLQLIRCIPGRVVKGFGFECWRPQQNLNDWLVYNHQ